MDWFEDDEMLRQWEEVSKEEENKTLRRNEGREIKSGGSAKGTGANGVTGADEGGKEGGRKEMENEVMKEILLGVPGETDAAGGGVTLQAASVAQSTDAGGDPFSKSGLGVGRKDWLEGAASVLNQKWDCSQAEDDFEEGDVYGLGF